MKRRYFSSLILPIIALLLSGLTACSDDSTTDPVQTSSIKGKVVDADSGTAIVGALVSTDPATGSATTDANGRYELKNILPGNYSVVVTKGGYKTSTSNVQVLGNTPANLDIQLESKATTGGGGGEIEEKDSMITALRFNGSNAMVVVPDADAFDLSDDDFTIEMWIKPSSLKTLADNGSNDQWNCLIGHGPDNSNLDYLFGIMDRKPMIYVRNYKAGHRGTLNLTADKWYHMAVVQDAAAGKLYIYVNGMLESESEVSVIGESTVADLFIGAREADGTGSGAHFYAGLMSDLRIWNVVRTEKEIADNRKVNLEGNESGLVAMWRMNEGQGQAIEDATGNGHIGVFFGDPVWVTARGPLMP